ncbi:MAG: Gfo/Idh/MocA family oxidoreductase [Abditibacteriota bacterium]|nr:Gfo/Idh/MocA family oxidoreductase [Abditibacteriota bacterium]
MVKIGIIGFGNMGRGHAHYLMQNKISNANLVAICDLIKPQEKIYKDLMFFYDYKELIDSGEVDAVIISTPHYFHTIIGRYALEKGIHTLVEKPISVHKADCEKLIKAHTDKNVIFSAMFNQRTRTPYKKIKELIPTLGNIQRLTCVSTDWYRTQAYYNSGSWRSTWEGEGGGVLLNQAQHQLDIIWWLLGMPGTVYANISLGKFHEIEVEDEVNAVFTYPNGAIGNFIASTGEFPGTNELEIQGDMGKLHFEGNKLQIWINNESSITYSQNSVNTPVKETKAKTSANYMATPKTEYSEIIFEEDENFLIQHATITQNFVNAILYGEPLIAPGEDGINAVQICNGIIMSGITGKKITFPLDSNKYKKLLMKLIKGEKCI